MNGSPRSEIFRVICITAFMFQSLMETPTALIVIPLAPNPCQDSTSMYEYGHSDPYTETVEERIATKVEGLVKETAKQPSRSVKPPKRNHVIADRKAMLMCVEIP